MTEKNDKLKKKEQILESAEDLHMRKPMGITLILTIFLISVSTTFSTGCFEDDVTTTNVTVIVINDQDIDKDIRVQIVERLEGDLTSIKADLGSGNIAPHGTRYFRGSLDITPDGNYFSVLIFLTTLDYYPIKEKEWRFLPGGNEITINL